MILICMNKNLYLSFTICTFLMSGAACTSRSEEKVTTLPLYEECGPIFASYLEETVEPRLRGGQDISLDYAYFDRRSEAHPSLLGYASVYSHNVPQEEVDLYVNGMTTSCYPRNYVAIELEAGVAGDIKDVLRRNEDQQITRNYLVYTDDEIRVYSNNKVKGVPKIEYERGLSTMKATKNKD